MKVNIVVEPGLEEEYAELEKRIAYLRSVLADEHKVMEIVKTELLDA